MLVDVAFLLMEISWGFVMGLLWLDLSGDLFLAGGGWGEDNYLNDSFKSILRSALRSNIFSTKK